jgi:hypothetical protein
VTLSRERPHVWAQISAAVSRSWHGPGPSSVDDINMYDELEKLRDELIGTGFEAWAAELLSAERSASTAGEAISNIAPILRRLVSTEGLQQPIQARVQAILGLMDEAWESGTRIAPSSIAASRRHPPKPP